MQVAGLVTAMGSGSVAGAWKMGVVADGEMAKFALAMGCPSGFAWRAAGLHFSALLALSPWRL